jgi:hypothetical protein
MISEEQLVEYSKVYLKQRGFKKQNKRWTKDIGDFTLVFFIQGSSFSKKDYYIRPGVFINGLETQDYYGHFFIQIESTNFEEIFIKFNNFCDEWTDKKAIKEKALAFIEWDKRNPIENRRANKVNYKKDPVPSYVFFAVSKYVMDYIINNF